MIILALKQIVETAVSAKLSGAYFRADLLDADNIAFHRAYKQVKITISPNHRQS
jgi:hypothetical protein